MEQTSLETYKQLVEEQSRALLDVVQSVALGDLDVKVEVPEGIEVLSELAVGVEMMIDDLREMLTEQERAGVEAEEARQRLAETLERVQAVQRRYLRQEWEGYLTDAEASRGYFLSESTEGPTAEAWLPAMTAAVQQGDTVTEGDKQQGATLAVPISLYGEVIGVMGFSCEGKERWSEDEMTVLKAIIEQVALALESQRLFDEEQRASYLMGLRVKELDCLNDIGRKIEETPPIPELLQWVAERIPPAMQYRDVCLAAVEFEGQVYGATEAMSLPCQIVQGLRIGGKLGGRVCIAYIQDHDFLDEESALLGDIVRRVSGYIESRRLFEQTQRRVTELASLNKLSASIGAGMRVGELVEQVLRQLNEFMEVHASYFALYDDRTDRIEFVLDFVQGQFRISDDPNRKLGKGRTAYIIRSRQPLLLRGDIQEAYRRLGIESSDERARAFLGVPMILAGRLIGVLAVQSYERDDAYDEYHLELLTTIAGQVAGALERARLLEQAQARAEELAVLNEMSRALTTMLDVDAVIESLYQYASPLIDTTNFYVALYDPERDEVSFLLYAEGEQKRRPEPRQAGKGLTEYIIRTREPLLIEENVAARLEELGIEMIGQDAQSWLGVPLIIGQQVIGVIGAQSYTTPRLYNERHRDLLVAIANQAAIAIQNARLFEDTKNRLAQLTALQETTRAVASILELDQLLNLITQQATTLLQGEGGLINLVDWKKKEDEVIVARGSCAHTVGFRGPLEDSLSGWVTLHNQPVISNRLEDDDRVDRYVRSGELQSQSAAIAPLTIKDQVVGTLVVMDKHGGKGAFDQADLNLLTAFADQAAIAIENARLFKQAQARAERERLVRTITDKIRRGADTEAIMRIGLEELSQMLGTDRLVVRLGTRAQLWPEPLGPSAELRAGRAGSTQDKPGEGLLSSQEIAARKMEDV